MHGNTGIRAGNDSEEGQVEKSTFVSYLLAAAELPSGGTTVVKKENKPKIINRLSRISGQVSGIQKMVEDDRYCKDILTQIAAVRSALDAVGAEVLMEHISGCVLKQGEEHPEAKGKSPEEMEEELRTLLGRLLA